MRLLPLALSLHCKDITDLLNAKMHRTILSNLIYNQLIFSDKKLHHFWYMSIFTLSMSDICVLDMVVLGAKTRLTLARVYLYRLRGGKPAKHPLLCKAHESIWENDYLCETTSGKQYGDECTISS